MKAILFLFILFPIVCFSQEKLTNKTILELQDLGFGSEVIVAKINNTPGEYDTSIEALQALKTKNVPPAVLAAMINKSEITVPTGIFFKSPEDKKKRINPLAFTGRKSNYLAAAFTYGIASNKSYAYLLGHTSPNIINIDDQVFEFKFDENTNSDPTSSNFFFMKASSPKDFVLVKLFSNDKKNHRGVKVGEFGGFNGNHSGIQGDEVINFAVSDEGEGRYRVRAVPALDSGEYCFIFQGTLPVESNYVTKTVYDFTILPK